MINFEILIKKTFDLKKTDYKIFGGKLKKIGFLSFVKKIKK